jgi:beta-galactosidase
MLDVVGQNYRENEILAAWKQKPTRKIIGTENDRSSLGQWLAMRDHPELSGEFIWAGVDYLGEARSWPNYGFSYGMLDRTAYKRPLAWQRQSWWSEEPMVYVARRTAPNTAAPTDPGYDPNDRPRNWTVTFEPGTIKAVCRTVRSGDTPVPNAAPGSVPSYELRTAGPAAAIRLTVDKAQLANDWNDVVFVTATIVDANGVPVPEADNMVRFDARGAGFIAAVDSADNTDHDPFQVHQRRAYQGRCLAYVKTDKASGKITVTASADGLKSNAVTLTVTK